VGGPIHSQRQGLARRIERLRAALSGPTAYSIGPFVPSPVPRSVGGLSRRAYSTSIEPTPHRHRGNQPSWLRVRSAACQTAATKATTWSSASAAA